MKLIKELLFIILLMSSIMPYTVMATEVDVTGESDTFELRARRDLYQSLGVYQMDLNEDGAISQEEYMARSDNELESFNELDINNDNMITIDELEVAGLVKGVIGLRDTP